MWDGQNHRLHSDANNDDLGFNNLYEPWRSIIVSVKTATANITKIQNQLRRERRNDNNLITSKKIAQALAKRGVLRFTDTIQISPNRNFVSIELNTEQIMGSFCA